MAIKTYAKGADTRLSANFKSTEFDCNGNGCCSATKIDETLVSCLQKIRDHFGAPVTLCSGYRCEKHNKTVANAAARSRHIYGMAADIKVSGVAPAQVAKYAESIGVKGIGLYEGADGSFVHIDTRTEKSFWYGHAQAKRTTFGGTPGIALELPQLEKGDQGAPVKAMQQLLMANSHSCGSTGADGNFGANTDAALRAYQKAKGLTADGICGANSWAKLLGVPA